MRRVFFCQGGTESQRHPGAFKFWCMRCRTGMSGLHHSRVGGFLLHHEQVVPSNSGSPWQRVPGDWSPYRRASEQDQRTLSAQPTP